MAPPHRSTQITNRFFSLSWRRSFSVKVITLILLPSSMMQQHIFISFRDYIDTTSLINDGAAHLSLMMDISISVANDEAAHLSIHLTRVLVWMCTFSLSVTKILLTTITHRHIFLYTWVEFFCESETSLCHRQPSLYPPPLRSQILLTILRHEWSTSLTIIQPFIYIPPCVDCWFNHFSILLFCAF